MGLSARERQCRIRNISTAPKAISMTLVDIDGTLLPYADKKFEHQYLCECGHEFLTTSIQKALPAFCSSCGGSTFKRNEPSLAECRSIVKEILSRNIPPHPGAVECVKRLAPKHPIFYVTGRDKSFFRETESWLLSNGFPYFSPHGLFMRESDDGEAPYRLKANLIEELNKGERPIAIIDDDLSLIAVAKGRGVKFIWAPICWETDSYYGKILKRL